MAFSSPFRKIGCSSCGKRKMRFLVVGKSMSCTTCKLRCMFLPEHQAGSVRISQDLDETSEGPPVGSAISKACLDISIARYQYDPLNEDSNEIRLLTILPGSFDSEVQVSLQIVPLTRENPPVYEALSYAWGSSAKPCSISVLPTNGTLPVTESLAVALRYLRGPDEPRIIWIDAICVDQENPDERSHQVQRMAEIYKLADRVVVWLGESDSDSGLALKLLSFLGSQVEVDWYLHTMKPASRPGTCVNWADKSKPLPYDKIELNAIYALIHRSWFERLWVRQEIHFASSKSILICGSDIISSATFWNAIYPLYLKTIDWDALGSLEIRLKYQERRRMIYKMKTIRYSDSLGRLIRNMNASKCIDPRDRIFAVLSLLSESESTLSIKPDYSTSTSEVYQDVTLRYIEHLNRLDIFRYGEMHDEDKDLPTWVPNWNVPMQIINGLSGFSASGKSIASAEYLGSGVLAVAGSCVSVIKKTSEITLRDQDGLPLSEQDMIQRIVALAPSDILDESYPGGGSMLDAYCRTMACDSFAETYLPIYANLPGLQNCKVLFADWIQGKEPSCGASGELEHDFQEDRKLYLIRVNYSLTRRLFFTSNEGYIGVVPKAARPGDEICVLLGCDSPLLLRPVEGGRHQLVGECYIHGLMRGEALLGPLPANFRPVKKFDEALEHHLLAYLDDETGVMRGKGDDPRLEPLPMDHGYYTDEYGPYFPPREGDPRMSVEALKRRGVDLKKFELV